ncbi:MAG: MGMT family protein [Peptococcaceae bacterium]|nr:MGMT family protein [Peptococcaceae bacterium]
MAKKTYNEKLNTSNDLPKIEDLSDKPEAMARLKGTKMLVAAPLQYNEIMAQIPEGHVTTVDRIRSCLAHQAGADVTCPLTAGIFTNICAHASVERGHDPIPYWRTLKTQGELNEKYPDGIDGHKLLLETEGHTIIQKGKRFFVQNYEDKLYQHYTPY